MSTASPSVLRSARRLLVVFAALLTAALVAVGSPASAHGGPINVEVSQDGLGGVYVFFFYEEDAHPIQAILAATVEGRSSTGEVVAPIPLSSASQGVGIWETAPGAFAPGQWEITVKISDPTLYEETVAMQITLADVVDDDEIAAANSAANAASTAESSAAASTDPVAMVGQWWPLALGVGVIVIAGIVVVLVARRGRASVRR